MTRRKRCPRCLERIPYTLRHCVRCGADPSDAGLWERRRTINRWMAAVVAVVLAFGTVLAVSQSDRYLPVVADWYTDLVLRFGPSGIHEFMEPDDREAIYVCALAVVKKLDRRGSVATFEGQRGVLPEPMGDGRYRVRSSVEETLESGAVVRHVFTCIARNGGGGRWLAEDVDLEENAGVAARMRSPR
jgi:hypothetical protein